MPTEPITWISTSYRVFNKQFPKFFLKTGTRWFIIIFYHRHHHLLYAGYLYLYSWDKICP